ncbi:MAG: peptidylprolyl isomerase [Alphaproteobacteria bacterium]|nr:peptidylprolyl isomerase [Alphaproteobacteria bacterium]
MTDKQKKCDSTGAKEAEGSKGCCGGSTACGDKSKSKCSNAIVIVLLALVVVAVGVLAFMSGKLSDIQEIGSRSNADRASNSTNQPDANIVLAVVNGEKITVGEVLENLANIPPQMQQMPQDKLIPFALQQIINNKLISQKAESAGLENNEDVIKQVEAAKKQIIRAKFINDKIAQSVTEESIKAEYEQYRQNFEPQDQIKASHILVEDESKAKEVIKKLNSGGDFAELAKENSIDGTAENGGELGSFTKADMVPEFAEAAFALEIGAHTKTPVKTQFGFHVIKVAEKGKSGPAPFEQIEPFIRQSLSQNVINEYIIELNKESEIKRFDMAGNEIKPAEEQEPSAGNEAAAEQKSEEPAQ